jgi:DNA-binding NarL/FixJ family response regulator
VTAGPRRLRVLVADDNAVLRMGLGHLLAAEDGIELVGEAASGEEAVEMAAQLAPDVVLLDVRMPGSYDGIAAATQLVDRTAVVMLTYSGDPDVVRSALAAGVRGYLVHGDASPREIVQAVRDAVAGRTVLSQQVRQLLVQNLVASPRRPQDGAAVPPPAPGPVADAPDHHGLTEREREIMCLIAQGLENGEIADRLYITRHTLKNHITRIFLKLGVSNRAQAVALWLGARS